MIYKKIRNFLTLPRILALGGLTLLVLLSASHILNAQAVTQGYGFSKPLQRGMVVQIKKDDATKVEPVTQKTMDQVHGIVVDPNDAPVTLSGNSGDKVFVAIAGHYDVLVSSQNGPIAVGDYITISAIDGVGMKAGAAEAYVIGRALTAFDGKTGAISTTQLKDSTGGTKEVNIARVQVDVAVGKNPFQKATESNVPEFLRKASTAIAGKEVSAVRIYVGLVVLLVTAIIASILLYAAVRSAVISIGRNPLSKKSILRGMFQVALVSLIIFISGLFGVYLLLKV